MGIPNELRKLGKKRRKCANNCLQSLADDVIMGRRKKKKMKNEKKKKKKTTKHSATHDVSYTE